MTLTNEEVLDMAFAWAETPQRQVCGGFADGSCPTTEGGYCVDCHTAAYSAANECRRRLINGLMFFLGRPERVVDYDSQRRPIIERAATDPTQTESERP